MLSALPKTLLLVLLASTVAAQDSHKIGVKGAVGCLKNPKKVDRLLITKPGVYENILVDGNWQGGNRVKITADSVVLRNCEIRNCSGNGIGVFANNVTIENCLIHHMLAGTFKEQKDSHGIAGHWGNVAVRNCEIFYVSGDCVQFDPDRKSLGKLTIEDCSLWTGPLPDDATGFKKGERPGENAVDTKTNPDGPRSQLIMRNCLMHGWKQPGQIGTMAALNIKENVHAKVEHCLVRDSEVAFRLRGPTKRGGALVEIGNCAVYDCQVGVRMEDKIKDLTISGLAFGDGVAKKYHIVGGGNLPGYQNTGEQTAPAFEQLLKRGFSQ